MERRDEPEFSTYRLYWLNPTGRVDSVADTIKAKSDEEAVQKIQGLSRSRTVEVWQGARRVAMLDGTDRTD